MYNHHTVICRLKGRIAEKEETPVAGQWHGKNFSAAKNIPKTIEQF
jgi:hypothetical protein